jgi:hypothetical protein
LFGSQRRRRKAEERREAAEEFSAWLKDVTEDVDDWTEPASPEPPAGAPRSTHDANPS